MKVDLYHAPPAHLPLCYHLPKPKSASFLYRLDQFPQPEAHCLLLLQPMEAIVLPFLGQPALLLRSFIFLGLNNVRQGLQIRSLFKLVQFPWHELI